MSLFSVMASDALTTDELDALQRLHLWKFDSISDESIKMTYDDEVALFVPRKNGQPMITGARVEHLPRKAVSGSAKLGKLRHGEEVTHGLFAMFEEGVRDLSKTVEALPTVSRFFLSRYEEHRSTQFIQRTGQLWSASQRLRSEMGFVTMHFPTTYRTVTTPHRGEQALVASVRILVPTSKSRVELSFLFEQGTMVGFPAALAGIEVEAKAMYGSAEYAPFFRLYQKVS